MKDQILNLLKNHPAFSGISSENLDDLYEKSTLFNYVPGQPISERNKIPSKIHIILQGEARLLGYEKNKQLTVAKLGVGNFIGLSSFLATSPLEDIIASTPTSVLSISDTKVLELYQKESSFQKWCQENILPGEVLSLSET